MNGSWSILHCSLFLYSTFETQFFFWVDGLTCHVYMLTIRSVPSQSSEILSFMIVSFQAGVIGAQRWVDHLLLTLFFFSIPTVRPFFVPQGFLDVGDHAQ